MTDEQIVVTQDELEEANEMINPDPESLDDRG